MQLGKAALWLERVISPIARSVNNAGIGILMVMMFLTVVDVFLRFAFDKPIVGAYEMSEFMMVILVFFALAYTETIKGHIRVDVLVSHFPPRAQAIIDSTTYFLGLGVLALIVWQNFLVGMVKLKAGEITGSIPLPVGPFHMVIVFGAALFCLVMLVNLLDSLAKAVQK